MQKCGVCGRQISTGMFQANYCRAFLALDLVGSYPGKTVWELAQASEIPYADLSTGLEKARSHQWVSAVAEDREQGGIRYRYFPLADQGWREDAYKAHIKAVEKVAGTMTRARS